MLRRPSSLVVGRIFATVAALALWSLLAAGCPGHATPPTEDGVTGLGGGGAGGANVRGSAGGPGGNGAGVSGFGGGGGNTSEAGRGGMDSAGAGGVGTDAGDPVNLPPRPDGPATPPADGPTVLPVADGPQRVDRPPADMAVDTSVGCLAPQMLCQNQCVDPRTDRANCGQCARSCTMGACVGAVCQCTNSARDGNETDVDCGGGLCAACPIGRACILTTDCVTGLTCLSGHCLSMANLVAYYDLDQPGPAITDVSGNGNNGTAVNAVRMPGKVGSAYRFVDGSCIRVPDSAGLSMSGGNALTVMAWINHTGGCASDHGVIVNKEFTYELGVECTSNALQHALWTTPTRWTWLGTRTVTLNQWQHVATTWDGTTARRYIDGQLVESFPVGGALIPQATGLGIGCRHVNQAGDGKDVGPVSSFTGSIDEVMVYSRALTAQELAAYHAATK